jgi:arylsulfatase A-like enzyme
LSANLRPRAGAWASASVLLLVLTSSVLFHCDNAERTNLVIISLDTVRRDHLPSYGYGRATAPSIDDFARRAVVFENAYTQETNTNPSHASLFTGLYPHQHGSHFNWNLLPQDQVTLAEILLGAGYRTAGFVSGVTMRSEASGLDRGFELYDDELPGKRRDGAIATKGAVGWLREQHDDGFFLLLHLYDAHGPYQPSESQLSLFRSSVPGRKLRRIPPYQRVHDTNDRPIERLNEFVDRYDAMIRYEDDLVAAVLDELNLDRTVVVILSDHGETLGERFRILDHGGQVFDEQVRIPLIVAAPGLEPNRVAAYVETIDLLPTLLELLDVPMPADKSVEGTSLVPMLEGRAQEGRAVVFSSAAVLNTPKHADRGYRLHRDRLIYSARSRRWKLIRYPGIAQDYIELYDMREDPGERRNVAEIHPEIVTALQSHIDDWLDKGTRELRGIEVPEDMRQQLRSLGYLGQ